MEKIQSDPRCFVKSALDADVSPICSKWPDVSLGLPEDLFGFLAEFYEVVLFDDDSFPVSKNTWTVGSDIRVSSGNTIFKFFGPDEIEPSRDEIHKNLYLIASSRNDGSERIGISLDPKFSGAVFYFRLEGTSPPWGMPKIANSFTEWIERTFIAGFDSPGPYWELPGFKDLGPIIPNDPYYDRIGEV